MTLYEPVFRFIQYVEKTIQVLIHFVKENIYV